MVLARWTELNNEVKIKDDNGQFQYEKDKEAVYSYFVDNVNKNMQFFHDRDEEFLNYMFKHDYYDKSLFDKYRQRQVKEIFKLVYGEKFRFESFMSAYKFYNNYATKTDDGQRFLERYEDRVAVNALFLGDGNYKLAKKIATNMIKQRIQPATPTFLNAGKTRAGRLVSCFLLEMQDNTESIFYVTEACAQLSRFGGGVAINLSKLRGAGDPIKGIENASTSIVGIAKILEDVFTKFNQLGQRNGSGAVYINALHVDAKSLLATKKINVDEKSRLKSLSVGLIIPSKLYELAERNENYFTFYPYSVYKEYGIELDDMNMDEWYDKLVNNPRVRKRTMGSARKLFTEIAQTQIESGYPYIFNRDVANKVHMLKDIGDIKMSNLCVEIMQLSLPSNIEGHRGVNSFGRDISCNLASLNIANVMDDKAIKESVMTAVDALTTVTVNTSIDEVPTVKNGNDAFHSIGLGAMNLHGYLAKNLISYESESARDFANTFFMTVRYYALLRSMYIAKERKQTFDGFEKSEYAKGTALTKYMENNYYPKTMKVQKLFKGQYIPSTDDWRWLNDQIMEHGIFHAYLMAIAPTGSISYVQNSTPSVMPITEQIETRVYGDSTTHFPMPFINNKNKFFYKKAYDMDMMKLIDMISVIQEHVDQSISTTLFIKPDQCTTRDLARYYIYAHKKGIKTLYYTRSELTKNDICETCSI
ncbi:class 1b ribonucleoside-diphosphate reductase subunit alpha [Virgibacillus sp. M23]|uniref:class 1b ribonucleoside-diphosphate reductase subunit alpha n=1 Tax=Virgibacillus sp. M23 TaxID=3079030 RepID=UPI002A9145DE|nr:class 1b ribonucleoside-diphosphate reductase subunit alpha [Virgibacillus sp. M23]MDY7043719.1 class 1b ribonucleoside-diphosphate reductase subunit alpha [Virgibacillus sp. M23]